MVASNKASWQLFFLPTNIHEKKDWNSQFNNIVLKLNQLTNQYPWEEGLKLTNMKNSRNFKGLTNQYPWEEGLKPPEHLRFGSSGFPYQPISMRRRIETISTEVSSQTPSLNLPTNIHEKKDWNFNIVTKQSSPKLMLTNQYPWEEGLKHNNLKYKEKKIKNLPTNIHEKKDWN